MWNTETMFEQHYDNNWAIEWESRKHEKQQQKQLYEQSKEAWDIYIRLNGFICLVLKLFQFYDRYQYFFLFIDL